MQHIEAALKKSAEMITSAYLPKLYKAAKELETTHYNIKKVDKSLTSIENELSTADQLVAANPNLHVTARTDFYSSATPQDGGNSVISSGGNSIILTIGNPQEDDYKDDSALDSLATQFQMLEDSPLSDVETKQILNEGIQAINMAHSIENYKNMLNKQYQ